MTANEIWGHRPTPVRAFWSHSNVSSYPFRCIKSRIIQSVSVLLVVQTFEARTALLVGVPTRPSQNSPERVAAWERRRASVGRRIRELRQKRGLTQEQLALRSGVTRPILNEVENGKRGLLFERLYDIAEALDVPASELMAE